MKNFNVEKLTANIESSNLNVEILYDGYCVAIVPVIDTTAEELDWDVSKAYITRYTPNDMTDEEKDATLKAIPEIMEKTELYW